MPISRKHRAIAASALVLALAPLPAHAFPAAEAASALSSMLGVLAALMAGRLPGRGRNRSDVSRAGRAALSAVMLEGLLIAMLLALAAHQAGTMRSWLDLSGQSRPRLELAGEHLKAWGADAPPPASEADMAWLSGREFFLDLDAYRRGEVAGDHHRIYLDRGARFARPEEAVEMSFRQEAQAPRNAYSGLSEAVAARNGRIILVGERAEDLVRTAQRLEADLGPLPEMRAIATLNPKLNLLARAGDDLPMAAEARSPFDVGVIDIRERLDFVESHGVVNARNVTAMDLLLLRDGEIRDLFATHRVLMGAGEDLYPALHARLAEVVPGRYAFFRGGIERHFFEDGETLTPPYINRMRALDPHRLVRLWGLTGKLRFLCTAPGECLPNIPAADRIDIPARDLDRQGFRRAIESLDPDKLYVSISTNQETAGNAMLAGYWLTTSGHSYLGNLALHDRFSVEELRLNIEEEMGESPTLQDWVARHQGEIDRIEALRRFIGEHGWLLAFAALGAGLRLALAPAQLLVIAGHYRRLSARVTLPASLAMVTGVLLAYGYLDRAIAEFAVLDHGTASELLRAGPGLLLPLLVILILAQAAMSFPERPWRIVAVTAVIAALWACGFLSAVPAPLLAFLVAAEAVALVMQAPFFLAHLARLRARRVGIYDRLLPGDEPGEFPVKWRLANEAFPQPGFLLDLRRPVSGSHLARQLKRIGKGQIILRSAALGGIEERLGGFHQSVVCEPALPGVLEALQGLSVAGCDFAWVQPLVEADAAGVLLSIGPDGQGPVLVEGPPGAATEGSRGTRSVQLSRGWEGRQHRAWLRLLRRAERAAGGPVVVEYSRVGQRLICHQIRPMCRDTHPETAFWPGGVGRYLLAEDYLARVSRLTGEVIERATGGDFVAVRGFLYRRRRTGPHLPISRDTIAQLERRAEALLLQSREPAAPAARIRQFEEGVELLGHIYRASQAIRRPTMSLSWTDAGAIRMLEGHELEIAAKRGIDPSLLRRPAPVLRPTRDHLHDLTVMVTAAIALAAVELCPGHVRPEDAGLAFLLGEEESLPLPFQADSMPLTSPDREETRIVVGGAIRGKAWSADAAEMLPADDGPWILVGEEIGSEWVRSLHRFAGILTVYGHANSHLGLSARAMGLPYRILPAEEMPRGAGDWVEIEANG